VIGKKKWGQRWRVKWLTIGPFAVAFAWKQDR
jgi:hypothetical protein